MLTVSPNILCTAGGGGEGGLLPGGVTGPGGCLLPRGWVYLGVSAPGRCTCSGGVCSWGCTWSRGVPCLGVYLVPGGCLLPRGGVSGPGGLYLVWRGGRVSAPRRVYLFWGGVSAPGGCLLQGGVCSQGVYRVPSLWTDRRL